MRLIPFIGLDDNGEMKLFVSPYRLNTLSPAHKRGKEFPNVVFENVTADNFEDILQAVKKYYEPDVKKKQAVAF